MEWRKLTASSEVNVIVGGTISSLISSSFSSVLSYFYPKTSSITVWMSPGTISTVCYLDTGSSSLSSSVGFSLVFYFSSGSDAGSSFLNWLQHSPSFSSSFSIIFYSTSMMISWISEGSTVTAYSGFLSSTGTKCSITVSSTTFTSST